MALEREIDLYSNSEVSLKDVFWSQSVMCSVSLSLFSFSWWEGRERIGQKRGCRLKIKTKTKKEKIELCRLQRTLQRHLMRTIGITNLLLVLGFIPVQAQSVQLLFSLMVSDFHPSPKTRTFPQRFFPTSLMVPRNGMQESEDVSEYRRKKSPNIQPEVLRNCGVRNKWRITVAPCFCTSVTVYSRLLAGGAMGTFTSGEIKKWLWKEVCQYGSQNYTAGGVAPSWCLNEYGSVFGNGGSIAKLKCRFQELVIGVNANRKWFDGSVAS